MTNVFMKCASILALAAASIVPAVPAYAQPGDISDLVGARGAGGETQMQNRGYENTGMRGGAQYWWNGSSRTCARIVVADGRYRSVTNASADDCRRGGGGNDAVAGAVAGAAVIGLVAALASHHRRSNDRHRQQASHDSEYERGYNDALYGGRYDNNDSEGYHEGYMAGEAESSNRRASNSRYVRGAAPQAALNACARRADEYQNLPSGSSVPVSVYNQGQGLYEITMATGHYRSRCSVDSRGRVSDMNPY